jgi:hypothetical protein
VDVPLIRPVLALNDLHLRWMPHNTFFLLCSRSSTRHMDARQKGDKSTSMSNHELKAKLQSPSKAGSSVATINVEPALRGQGA